jgi:hypothetical protein
MVTSDVFQCSSPIPENEVAPANMLFRLVTRAVKKFDFRRPSKERQRVSEAIEFAQQSPESGCKDIPEIG